MPDVHISAVFSELCLPGKEGQSFYNRAVKEGHVSLIRLNAPDAVKIYGEDEKTLVQYADFWGVVEDVSADMVVLAPAMVGSGDARDLATIFGLCQDGAGFFVEDQTYLAPVSTPSEGVYVAGCAQGPQDIATAVAQGQATAGKILSALIPGEKLVLDGTPAKVNGDLCAGCKTCVGVCPYKAITYDEDRRCCVVNEIMCRGCGVCSAACPSGAMEAKHFSDEAISAELEGLTG
jgi:heterodisulfide reductase subunit A